MEWSSNRYNRSIRLWIYCPWYRFVETGMARGFHSIARRQWFHDRFRHQHRGRTGTWIDGYHGVQVRAKFMSVDQIQIECYSTRAATFHVIINTLKGLPRTTLDAAWGLPGLAALYLIRIACTQLSKRFPRRSTYYLWSFCENAQIPVVGRLLFFISVARNAFVIIVLTIAAWLYCRHHKSKSGKYPIKILQTVPRGFQHVGPPIIDSQLVKALAPQLPVATIILLLEHIAISKCG